MKRCVDYISKELRNKSISYIDSNPAAKWFFNPVVFGFFYGICLFLFELKIFCDVISPLHAMLIVWAGIVSIYNLLIKWEWKTIPGKYFLILFSILAGITAITTVEVGLVHTAKAWIMLALPLCAFYPICLAGDAQERKAKLIRVLLGAAIVMFIASAIALGMYFARYTELITFLGVEARIGILHYIPGDPTSGLLLYGIYVDTNHAAAFALIFAVYSIVLFKECKNSLFSSRWGNKLGQVFAVANLIVQLCYFPLANSRGAWLSALVSCFVVGFLVLFLVSTGGRKHIIYRLCISLGGACILTSILYGSLFAVREGVVKCSDYAYSQIILNQSQDKEHQNTQPGGATTPGATQPTDDTENKGEEKPGIEPDNPQDPFLKDDLNIGSGRLDIWHETLQLFTMRPLFGTGKGNNAYYAGQYGIGEILQSGKAVHNSYLDLLVSYGAIGFAIFMSFWMYCLWSVLGKIKKFKQSLGLMFYANVVIVLIVACSSMFLTSVFIATTAMYYVMLIAVGYLMSFQKQAL